MNMYRKLLIFSAVFCILLTSCGQKAADTPQNSVPEKRVTAVATRQLLIPYTAPAQIRGKEDIEIYPQVTGTLDEVLVKEGQAVKKGQRMFIINATAYQAAVENAMASVVLTQANVETHKIELEATKQLYLKGVVAEHQYKVHANNLAVAQAQLDEAEAVLKRAKNDLSHTTICAPHDGVVGTIGYRQGSLVGPQMQSPITVVSDNSKVYAYVSMNGNTYMEMLREYGSKETMIDSLPDVELLLGQDVVYPYTGRIETISGVIDNLTGAVSVRAAFDNPERILSSGASGELRISFEYEGIVIPRSATYEIQDKHFVYKVVKEADGSCTAVSSEVATYRLDNSSYLIDEGLKDGDIIVLEGVSKMRNGMKIVPKQE